MHNLSGIGYVALSNLARILPPAISYLLGETFAACCFLLCRGRRRGLVSNLGVVLGQRRGHELTRTAFRVMVNFGRSISDVFMIPHLSEAQMLATVSIAGREHLDSALAKGRGVILVTGHLGSWELGGARLAGLGYGITTVAGVQFTKGMSPYIKAMKEARGIGVVSAEGGTLRIVRALRRGGIVALHVDGDQYLGGIAVRMFGRRTVLPRGPAGLAIRTGAAIVPAFAIRTARSKIVVSIGEEISAEGRGEESLTQAIAAALEDCINRYADQWCMFRPLWETED